MLPSRASSTPCPSSPNSPLLLNLQPIDEEDVVDQEMRNCHRSLASVLTIASEKEANSILQEKANLNYKEVVLGLLYALLTEPAQANLHFRQLNYVCRDGFSQIISKLAHFSGYIRFKNVISTTTKKQMVWLLEHLTVLHVKGLEPIYLSLLKQIRGGDTSHDNIWLLTSMLDLLNRFRDNLHRTPNIIGLSLYKFLQLIPEHASFPEIKKKEIDYCSYLLQFYFMDCVKIGRDLIFSLQMVARIPEFEKIWNDMYCNPHSLSPNFKGIYDLLSVPSAQYYIQIRVSQEMEQKLIYIMDKVPWGNQQRQLMWFHQRFLKSESEYLYIDLIRFICCVYHPKPAVLQSNMTPRYVVIGWLMRNIKSPIVGAYAKLALVFDWLYYNPRLDNILNIDPAFTLIFRSLERNSFFASVMIEFLYITYQYFVPEKKDDLLTNIRGGLGTLIQKGAIRNLDTLVKPEGMSSDVKGMVYHLFGPFLTNDGDATLSAPTVVNVSSSQTPAREVLPIRRNLPLPPSAFLSKG